jgi:hypothetical protein
LTFRLKKCNIETGIKEVAMYSSRQRTKIYMVVLGSIAIVLGYFSFLIWVMSPEVSYNPEEITDPNKLLYASITLVWLAVSVFFPFSNVETTKRKIENIKARFELF